MADKLHTVSDGAQTWIWAGIGIFVLAAIVASIYFAG